MLNCSVNDSETEQVFAGDNIKLKLKGVEDADIMPGFVLCSLDSPCPIARVFDAEVLFYYIMMHYTYLISILFCLVVDSRCQVNYHLWLYMRVAHTYGYRGCQYKGRTFQKNFMFL